MQLGIYAGLRDGREGSEPGRGAEKCQKREGNWVICVTT